MIGFLSRFFSRSEPVLSDVTPRDAAALATLHSVSFRRGWGESEFEQLLTNRNVIAHRAMAGHRLVGFIVSRMAADEAEILSVAVEVRWRGRGLARQLLNLNLRRLAGLGARAVFLEVDEDNASARALYKRAGFREVGRRPGYYTGAHGEMATALVLRRDLG